VNQICIVFIDGIYGYIILYGTSTQRTTTLFILLFFKCSTYENYLTPEILYVFIVGN